MRFYNSRGTGTESEMKVNRAAFMQCMLSFVKATSLNKPTTTMLKVVSHYTKLLCVDRTLH